MAGLFTGKKKGRVQGAIASRLDVSVTVQRAPAKPGFDVFGHDTSTYNTGGTAIVEVNQTSATLLQAYAGIIGSELALLLRFMPTTDIKEGDQIVYAGRNWKTYGIQSAESYTFTDEVLIVTIS